MGCLHFCNYLLIADSLWLFCENDQPLRRPSAQSVSGGWQGIGIYRQRIARRPAPQVSQWPQSDQQVDCLAFWYELGSPTHGSLPSLAACVRGGALAWFLRYGLPGRRCNNNGGRWWATVGIADGGLPRERRSVGCTAVANIA
jgi:hypothetical protein